MDGGYAQAEDSEGRLKVRPKAERPRCRLAEGVKKMRVKLSSSEEDFVLVF